MLGHDLWQDHPGDGTETDAEGGDEREDTDHGEGLGIGVETDGEQKRRDGHDGGGEEQDRLGTDALGMSV